MAVDMVGTEEASDVYVFPASYGQGRLWFVEQLRPGSTAYIIAATLHLRGPLVVPALADALAGVVARHESLRTTFRAVGGQPYQVISPHQETPLPVEDLRALPDAERAARAAQAAAALTGTPFDLAMGPLLRARLLRLGADEHTLLLSIHHLVADEWSLSVLLHELSALYSAQVRGAPSGLADLPIQYADYAEWQRERLAGAGLADDLAWWREALAGAPRVLALPTDRARPAQPSGRGAHARFLLPAAVRTGLATLGQDAGATLFMSLLAGYGALLGRYSGQEVVLVGSPIAGRTRSEVEGLIGFFVNTLALRVDLRGDPTFGELVRRVRAVTLGAYGRQEAPFERVVEAVRPARDLSRSPLVQVMFVMHNAPKWSTDFAGLELEAEVGDAEAAKFDLSLLMAETEDGLEGIVEYSTDLFEPETIDRLTGHLRTLLESAIAHPERRLSALALLTEGEQRQLDAWNQTAAPYPADRCVHELFEEQAERTPTAVAVIAEGTGLTYGDLNARANQLARRLRALGIGPEARVGICMDRSAALVVGLLAILKAGAAYVPLDPAYPAERLSFMLRDAQVAAVLTEERLAAGLPTQGTPVIRGDGEWPAIAHESVENLRVGVTPDSPAYLIYTSGSTGQPKGVIGLHRGAVNRFAWMWKTYPFQAGEVCCQKTSLSFVDSVWEVFGPLPRGIPTVLIPDRAVADPQELVKMLAAASVTRIVLVPSLLRALLDAYPDLHARLPALTFWVSSGEALPADLWQQFRARLPQCRLINLYGSSEVAADVTWCETTALSAPTTIPIGRPIANTAIHVLDRQLRQTPIGVPGEVYVAGAGLARGYFNRPDLTAAAFIPDPFASKAGARLYRTGDLARLRPDGSLEFLGRRDQQVKVRGFRVEPREIEAILGRLPSVLESVVPARADRSGDSRLVAYVVPRPGHEIAIGELRRHLQQHLPPYMLPTAFVLLDALPLTPNGKLDRGALPSPDQASLALEHAYVAPRTPEEEQIAAIWIDLLGLERAGVYHDFFELGGHSLAATRVISRLRDAFQVEVPLIRIFEHPTIAALAAAVAEIRQSSAGAGIEAIPIVSRAARRAQASSLPGY